MPLLYIISSDKKSGSALCRREIPGGLPVPHPPTTGWTAGSKKERIASTPRFAGAPKGRLCPAVPDEVVEYLFDIDPEDEPGLLPAPPVGLLPVVFVSCKFDDPLDEGMDP